MSTGNSNNVSPSASPGIGSSNAPKYGTLVPNRVFVGGISPHTTEAELHQLFSSYGNVKATKIIQDRAGVSKGYGFVTFETEDEARRLQNEGDNIIFKDRKLNIAPAIKKQPFSRMFDPSTASPTGTVLFHNGMPYTYQNGMAVFPPQEFGGGYPAQPQYPVMYSPQPVIMPQQNFQYQPNQPQWPQSNSQWRWTAPIGYAPQPSSGHQYVYAHSVPPAQSAGVQVITIPQQPVAPSAGEFYASQPPPVYHHQEAQATAAEHEYHQEVKDGSSDWSENGLDRLSALCLDASPADGLRSSPAPAATTAAAENGYADNGCYSESGELPPRAASAESDSARATSAGHDPCEHSSSPSPLPLTPPSSSVSPSDDSVSSTTKSSASPQPTLGESGFASHISSSGTEQDSCDGEPSPSKSPSKPPKYTILAPQMSQMYMTPNAVPHYHIWTPYYTLQTSAGAIQAPAGGKGCLRHGYAHVSPPVPPPPSPSGGRVPACWLHSGPPPPPLPVHASYPCSVPSGNEPFSPSSDQVQRARYASPCKPPLTRGGYMCGPRAGGGVASRCGAQLKQPDLGGAGDAPPPPRSEQAGGPMTPPLTPGRGVDQPAAVETAATRLQTMTL